MYLLYLGTVPQKYDNLGDFWDSFAVLGSQNLGAPGDSLKNKQTKQTTNKKDSIFPYSPEEPGTFYIL